MERLTIDQAIAHAQEVAETRTDLCDECRQEHEQLAKWLTELKAYEDAEQDGRLVVLPCKVGDTLYSATCGKMRPFVVAGFELYGTALYVVEQVGLGREHRVYGKTAFLTREEAEAEMKGGAE